MSEARILVSLNQIADANEILEQIRTVHPDSVECLTVKAELCRKLNQLDKAKELLVRCTKLAPKEPQVWERLGDYYLSRKDRAAISCFAQAIELRADDALAWAGLAAANAQAKKIAEAEKDYRQAVDLNRRSPTPNATIDLLCADFLRDGGSYQSSVAEYGRALTLESSLMPAYLGRAASFIQLKDWIHAEQDLEFCSQDSSLQL